MQREAKTSAKERILHTASRLFHQQGFNSTGINQVIAEANVAKATLYQHYRSKDLLCIAFLDKRHTHWFSKLESFVKNKDNKVLAAFDFIKAMNKQENYRGCSFLNILSEITAEQTEILTVIQQHKLDLIHFFSNQFPNEQNELAYHIYMLFESAIIESQMFRSQEPVERTQSIVQSLLKNK